MPQHSYERVDVSRYRNICHLLDQVQLMGRAGACATMVALPLFEGLGNNPLESATLKYDLCHIQVLLKIPVQVSRGKTKESVTLGAFPNKAVSVNNISENMVGVCYPAHHAPGADGNTARYTRICHVHIFLRPSAVSSLVTLSYHKSL